MPYSEASTIKRGSVVLVTGGAGFIGSHIVLDLCAAGVPAVVLDNLITGSRAIVPPGVPLVEGDIGNPAVVRDVIVTYGVTTVVHCAASLIVSESVYDPLSYYRNNTFNSLSLIESCVKAGVKQFVYSSSASVYGVPERTPVEECAVPRPISPYGYSKLMTEQILHDAAAAHDLRFVALRYFNVAGADPQGRSGQVMKQGTHLIKVACEAAIGRRPHIDLFGEDYPTPDGTCMRDYIHVSDLATVHVRSLAHLSHGGRNLVLNCGYGRGFTVREVLNTVEQVIGRKLPILPQPRRPKDPPILVAGTNQIKRVFGWRPHYDHLETIVRTALAWEQKTHA